MQEYASDFIGKPLFTRGGERAGYVKNVQTDARLSALRNLECCDDEEEEFILPLSALAQAAAQQPDARREESPQPEKQREDDGAKRRALRAQGILERHAAISRRIDRKNR